MWVVENDTHLSGCLPQNPQPQFNNVKKIRHIPLEGYSIKYVASTPQNCQGHEKQGKSGKLFQPRRV